MERVEKGFSVQDTRIIFPNFEGKAGKFNNKGKRNFCVLLESDDAEQLEKDGWNIKWLKPRDPLDKDQAFIKVNVNFNVQKPPKIVLIKNNKQRRLDEDSLSILDWAEIATVDISISPYNYEVMNKVGVRAYVKTMYVTLQEDEFEGKYVDVPDSALNVSESDDGD